MEDKLPKFSKPFDHSSRIHTELWLLTASKLDMSLLNWCNSLEILFCEISPDLDEKELKEKETELNNLKSLVVTNSKHNMKLWNRLRSFEYYIRKKLKETGQLNQTHSKNIEVY